MDSLAHEQRGHRAKSREFIGGKVRALRLERHLTQAELCKSLRLSQARLSEIERGGGSFTAEQFLQILRLFNASVADFDPSAVRDEHAELQNVLARLGASELRENTRVLPSEQLHAVNNALRETLIVGSPRLLTALGPVIVSNVDRINLRGLYTELAAVGLERRMAWLVENVRDAVASLIATALPSAWSKRYRRTLVVLDAFLDFTTSHNATDFSSTSAPDILDSDIRSKQSLIKVQAASTAASKRWGIVTSLQSLDFGNALKDTHAAD